MKLRIAAVAVGILALAVPSVAQAAPSTDGRFTLDHRRVPATTKPQSLNPDASVNVIVEMSGDPVAVVEAKSGRKLSETDRAKVRKDLKTKQDAVRTSIVARGGKVTADMQSAYNGLAVRLKASKVGEVAALPGVVAIHEAPVQTIENTVSVPFVGAPGVWQSTGYTGRGVKVAIIDTGIDYTHADFGGPGTTAAYETAKSSSAAPADPTLFGPGASRIKGGIDLVGDGYDANGKTGSPVPVPDANPLDCQGHGSHVAGTVGGSGVTEAGATYAGPYDASTPSKSFKVGPGVAPQADLYAVRVFGCSGSTDVTTQAIDWAVKNGMDVINMSLGSPFGRPDDPSSAAAANAVAAGVVVVASAGNSGANPYLVGGPSTGRGVISVAAVDSAKDFPGVTLGLSDGTTMTTINANGATALPAGPLSIVILADDPATPENEALGCSVAAYTSNGVVAGGKQLAIVMRGTCARVAKAIYGQDAGAAAVLMTNSTGAYPPYEGVITANPDTGAAANVTIPFLGVRSSDRAALVAAASAGTKVVSLTATRLPNPTYTSLADFTSGGARNGDSGLKPTVSAPGVSIASAAVGSGTGFEIMSGTSMAAPHVAGIAALTKQAHPGWSVEDVTAAVTSTADPEKVGGAVPYRLTLGGGGMVDLPQAVATSSVALGDAYLANGVRLREAALNFGFAEFGQTFDGFKDIEVHNLGNTPVRYAVSAKASPQSKPGSVRFDRSSVVVPAHGTAKVRLMLTVKATDIPSSEGAGFQFWEVSGNVVLTSASGVLRVPYLLVPRSTSNVSAVGPAISTAKGIRQIFVNSGRLSAGLDFYAWGLSDARDNSSNKLASGYDLRAAGVASADSGDPNDPMVVFAINNWTRASNMAANEVDVNIDTNGDGAPDYVVFSADLGNVTTGDFNGKAATFVYDVAHQNMWAESYSIAPTDSSTLLLPVYASSLGLTAASGDFAYSVSSYSMEDATASDEMPGVARYNPFVKLLGEGAYTTVAPKTVVRPGATADFTLPVNAAAVTKYAPLGLMVVVFDNASGAPEALLVQRAKDKPGH